MHRVRQFSSPFVADRAADYLRGKGIPATVVGHHVNAVIAIDALKFAQLDLVVATRHHRDRALELLPEFYESLDRTAAPDEGSAEWETEATPDLGRLDSDVKIHCPDCQYELAIHDERMARCPECGSPFEALNLIIQQHGPEALQSCYTDAVSEIEEIDLTAFDVPCPSCRYSLGGLPTRERCPECGTLYDKEQIIAGWL